MRWLVFSHLFIALCAVSLTLETIILSGINFSKGIPYLIVVFFATVITYNLKGIKKIYADVKELENEKESWSNTNVLTLKILFIGSFVLGIASLFFLQKNTIYALLPLGALSIGYSWSLKYGGGIFSLRAVPFLKVLLVAIVWTLVVAVIPFVNAETSKSVSLELVISNFMFLFALAILFDIKDLRYDRLNNIMTTPLLIGVSGTKIISIAILMGRVLFLYSMDIESSKLLIEVILGIVFTIIILKYVDTETSEFFFMSYIDGMILFKSFLLIWYHIYFVMS